MDRKIRVLVVDDSAYVRKVVKEMLSRSPCLEVVGTARDGDEALEMVARLKPDVVTCDLIRKQMEIQPIPIVVISIAAEASERVLSALDAGAVDFVQKPTALATDKILDMADDLVAKVEAAAAAPVVRLRRPARAATAPIRASFKNRYDLLVIGVSTGGPQGLKRVIPRLPADFPVPVVIVMHMPPGYTQAYAKRLDEMSSLTVIEASEGEQVRPGVVFVAPAGRHLTFSREPSATVRIRLDVSPLDTPHRPSVDVLFQSAAEVYGGRVLALVMTGMGDDGRQGAAWIKARGGDILTEAEETCVVYGMPRSVVEAGLSDASVPLDRLTDEIVERI
jgi:two-component system chemotaxis response regulator CheB